MEKMTRCRICRAVDIKMYSIGNTDLKDIYETLIAKPFKTNDRRPLIACYICHARLRNCYQLRKTCLESEEYYLTESDTHTEMKEALSQDFGRSYTLRVTEINHLSIGSEYEVTVHVKEEPMELFHEINVKEEYMEDYPGVMDGDDTSEMTPADDETASFQLKREHILTSPVPLMCVSVVEETAEDIEAPGVSDNSRDERSEGSPSEPYLQDPGDGLVPVGKKRHQCTECMKSFSSKSSLKTHAKVHTSEKPYQCQYCQKFFRQKVILDRHIRTHTGEKPYKCEHCDKCFSQRGNLLTHLRTHTGEKPYMCKECHKCFGEKSNLNMHMRLHSESNPYKCDYCEKTFVQKNCLIRHERIHTGEKPYKCDWCDKCFREKGCLKIHVRIHTGEKPYECDQCHKCFSQITTLKAHMKQHTGEKPFQCDVCQRCFTQKCNYKTHMRTHTGE